LTAGAEAPAYKSTRRNRNALAMTDTEL